MVAEEAVEGRVARDQDQEVVVAAAARALETIRDHTRMPDLRQLGHRSAQGWVIQCDLALVLGQDERHSAAETAALAEEEAEDGDRLCATFSQACYDEGRDVVVPEAAVPA